MKNILKNNHNHIFKHVTITSPRKLSRLSLKFLLLLFFFLEFSPSSLSFPYYGRHAMVYIFQIIWLIVRLIVILVFVEFKLEYIKSYYPIFHHNSFIIYLFHLNLIHVSVFFIFQLFFIIYFKKSYINILFYFLSSITVFMS